MSSLLVRMLLASTLSFSLWAAPARAEGDDTTRSTARRLGEEGVALMERGEHRAAFEKFERALDLLRVPTLALLAGQSLEALGRLVEASERYRAAAGMQIDPSLPGAFQAGQVEAQAQAAAAERALRARLPVLFVTVRGARLDEVTLTLDGKALPTAMAGVDIPVDPGEHRVEARRPNQVVGRSARVAEKERAEIVLDLLPSPVVEAARPAPTTVAPPRRPASGAYVTSLWPTVAVVALSVGAVGLGAGGVFWLRARSKADSLEAKCSAAGCPPAQRDAVDAYDRDKTLATIGLVAGGAIAGAGVAILLAAPKSSSRSATGVWIGPGSVSLRQNF